MDDPRLSELCIVQLVYDSRLHDQTYMIRKDQLDRFIEASVQLHYDPGVNPRNNVKTARLYAIRARTLAGRGPYWWTTPGLQGNNDPAGAVIYDGSHTLKTWYSEEAKREMQAEADAEAWAESRMS